MDRALPREPQLRKSHIHLRAQNYCLYSLYTCSAIVMWLTALKVLITTDAACNLWLKARLAF